MIPFVCDTRQRITSRLYLALGTDVCPCCNFWRGALFGACIAGASGVALSWGLLAGAFVACIGLGALLIIAATLRS